MPCISARGAELKLCWVGNAARRGSNDQDVEGRRSTVGTYILLVMLVFTSDLPLILFTIADLADTHIVVLVLTET